MIQYDGFYVFCRRIMCLYVYLVFAGLVKDKFKPWLTIKMYCIVLYCTVLYFSSTTYQSINQSINQSALMCVILLNNTGESK